MGPRVELDEAGQRDGDEDAVAEEMIRADQQLDYRRPPQQEPEGPQDVRDQ